MGKCANCTKLWASKVIDVSAAIITASRQQTLSRLWSSRLFPKTEQKTEPTAPRGPFLGWWTRQRLPCVRNESKVTDDRAQRNHNRQLKIIGVSRSPLEIRCYYDCSPCKNVLSWTRDRKINKKRQINQLSPTLVSNQKSRDRQSQNTISETQIIQKCFL